MMTDETLIEQYGQTGDRHLLDTLVERNFDRIYRFVGSMIGQRAAVDDIVQDVLLSVIRHIGKFRGDASFSTWIYKIATNRVYRHFEMTRKTLPTLDRTEIGELAAKNSCPAESNELKAILDDAISALSPALRAAILLTTTENLSPEEAAVVEGCSAANIHWRVHKARKILKEHLRKHWED